MRWRRRKAGLVGRPTQVSIAEGDRLRHLELVTNAGRELDQVAAPQPRDRLQSKVAGAEESKQLRHVHMLGLNLTLLETTQGRAQRPQMNKIP